MIKLTYEYEVKINFDVEAASLPKGKILTSNADSVISITVKATGIDFYSRMIKARTKPLQIELRNLNLHRKADQYFGYLRTSRNFSTFSSQLPSGVEILAIEPDTLHFIFEKTWTKLVVVKPDVSLKFSRQYQLYDSVSINPDSIWISGLKNIVDTIRSISTEQKTYSSLKSGLIEKLALIKPEFYPPISFSSDSVEIKLEVEKFTEAKIEVPVRMNVNKLKGSSYRTFPEKVEIICLVAMKDYTRLDPSMFTLFADPESGKETNRNRIPVTVGTAPSFVKVIKIEPDMVEYLIIK
ncbi:MAG: hypothetical protein K0B15_00120 [Lentimicrobium sp.]|nr:hypothetical protein [Lentimicrobium sp.]